MKLTRYRVPGIVFLSLFLFAGISGLSAQTTELPVTRVVLYSSGVGFFEHTGSVQDNAVARFLFKTDQINDVLKSMILRDFNGGTVGSISYASQDPLERALKSFAIDLSDRPAIAQILDRVRGADVTLMAPQAIQGKILGIEQEPKTTATAGATTTSYEVYVDIVGADGFRKVPLSSISSIKLSDQRLNDEISRALALIIDSADTQRKSVDVHFDGKGSRRVAVDYISEAPVWKTSYRLDLSQAGAVAAGGSAPAASSAAKTGTASSTGAASPTKGGLLQAWAIVENTSDSDWSGINLSLVSGSPISFTQDLYTPLYVTRPDVAPIVQAQVAPKSYDQGMGQASAGPAAGAPMSAPAPAMAKSMRGADLSAEAYADEESTPIDLGSSAPAPVASGAKFGDLFNFNIKSAVTLPRRQSAMFPLLNQEIGAEKVSIYNAATLPRNPLAGARIYNTSGLRLPPGPVTVFDGGMYAGDALMDTFGDKDQRFISYAVDLDVLIDSTQSSSSAITKISINRGVLSIQRMTTYSQTYAIQNNGTSDKVLVIEHPRNTARTLSDPAQPLETTDSLYRFRVPVAKTQKNNFVVKEQQPGTDTVALINSSPNSFLLYVDNASPAVKAALQNAAAMKQNISKIQGQIATATQQKAQISSDQERLRDNIDTVGRDSPQGQKYLQRLMDGEDSIDSLNTQLADLQTKLQKANDDLSAFLQNLNVQ